LSEALDEAVTFDEVVKENPGAAAGLKLKFFVRIRIRGFRWILLTHVIASLGG
jgi:hypothetical protein